MPGDGVTSLSLLQRVRVRDAPAWRRLVALYRPLVCHWCQRGGVRPADVDDVAQEVFLAVANGLGQFDHRGAGSFRAWLRGVTRHKLLDFHARQGRQPAAAAGGTDAFQALQAVADPEPGSTDDLMETSGLYRRALDLIRGEFEERTWQAFWRAGVEDEDTAAVAAALGMTPVAVRIAKSRVLARLREEAGELIG
jgi:RNA polymerase sigma-70 factor (ECF subfamily)